MGINKRKKLLQYDVQELTYLCLMKYSKMFIFLLLFSSCQTTEDPPAPDTEFESIHVNLDNAEPLHMSDYFSQIEYIHLETPDDKPIGRIRKFLIRDEYLGFYDAARNSVWVYTHDGDFVNEFAIPRGRGPGELESIEDIILH